MNFIARLLAFLVFPIALVWQLALRMTETWTVVHMQTRSKSWLVTVRSTRSRKSMDWSSTDNGLTWSSQSAPYLLGTDTQKNLWKFLRAAIDQRHVEGKLAQASEPPTTCAFCTVETGAFCDALVEEDGVLRGCGAHACNYHNVTEDKFVWCPRHWHTNDRKHIHTVPKPPTAQAHVNPSQVLSHEVVQTIRTELKFRREWLDRNFSGTDRAAAYKPTSEALAALDVAYPETKGTSYG